MNQLEKKNQFLHKTESKECSQYPNSLEEKLLQDFIALLKQSEIKFTKQKFDRGTKLHGKLDYTRVTFHVYNVSDGGRGW